MTLVLIRNADVYAPNPLGTQHLLIGGGRILWMGSDAGGCLPCFDADGHVSHMDVGSAGALLETVREALARGLALEAVLPAITSNPAKLLRLARKGTIAVGQDADLLVLDANGAVHTLLVRGAIPVRDGAATLRGMFE